MYPWNTLKFADVRMVSFLHLHILYNRLPAIVLRIYGCDDIDVFFHRLGVFNFF